MATTHHGQRKRAARAQWGVRCRVMMYLVVFVACMLALLWLCQIVWLDEIYRWNRTRQVHQASDAVTANLDNALLESLVDHLASRSDVCILLLDANHKPILFSEDIRSCLIHRMSKRDLAFWCDMAPTDGSVLTELFHVAPMMEQPVNPRSFRGHVPQLETQRQSLLCARRVTLPGGSTGYLLLNSIITPLDSTVETLRMQLIGITAAVLVGAVLLALLISRRVAQPIIHISDAARSLSRGEYVPPDDRDAYREIADLSGTLTLAAREISQVERLQHELIANISHDLRTPLTMIGGYAEAMRDLPGEATAENYQIIIDETNRLTSLVSELLDFSKLQTGSVEMAAAPFCLTDMVGRIVQRVACMTGKDGYILRFAPDTRLWVLADERRMEQVVYNLLGNALTYTGDDRTVSITQTVQGDTVRITIHDSGKGIPADELPLIWKRYYRSQESHRRAVIGSGLGLSIVQSILEKHGADYGVESAEGTGTAFWFACGIVPAPDEA